MSKREEILTERVASKIRSLKEIWSNNIPERSLYELNEATGVIWEDNFEGDFETIDQGYVTFTDEIDDSIIEECYEINYVNGKCEIHSPVTFLDNQINQDIDFDFTESGFYLSPLPKREWSLYDQDMFRENYKVWVFLAESGKGKEDWNGSSLGEYGCWFCQRFRQPGNSVCPLAYGYTCANSALGCCKGLFVHWALTRNKGLKKKVAREIRNLIARWLIREGILEPSNVITIKEEVKNDEKK